jgi:hypothetical protein
LPHEKRLPREYGLPAAAGVVRSDAAAMKRNGAGRPRPAPMHCRLNGDSYYSNRFLIDPQLVFSTGAWQTGSCWLQVLL